MYVPLFSYNFLIHFIFNFHRKYKGLDMHIDYIMPLI